MSSKIEKKKKQLIALLDEATNTKNAKLVNEAFGKVKKVELKITATIRRLKKVDDYLKKNNRPRAKKIYKAFFFNMSTPDFGSLKKVKAKKVFTVKQIEQFLDNRSKLSKVIRNLNKAHRTFRLVLGPVGKAIKAYNIICNTKKSLQKASEVYDLYQAQKNLKTAESYRQYYKNAGKLFGEAAEVMKIVTSFLPRGASDYCDYILTVATRCGDAITIVSDYSKKIIDLTNEVMGELEKAGDYRARSNNVYRVGVENIKNLDTYK